MGQLDDGWRDAYDDVHHSDEAPADKLWVCRDGRRMRPSQMSDTHLANSIAKILRDSWRRHWLGRLMLEQTRRKR